MSALVDAAAAVSEVAGRPIALRYTRVESEYAALRDGAILVDRSHRTRMTFEGPRAAELLTGLVTNDVLALATGAGQYAAALTPRGKIIADVRLFARDQGLLVDVPVRASEGWTGMVRKYVNPRLARYVDRTEEIADIGVFGAESRRVVAEVSGVSVETLGTLAPYHHAIGAVEGTAALVTRSPELGVEGYEVFLPWDAATVLWRRGESAGATPAGLEAWDIARIEAGRPEWGLDIDESTIPQEANFDDLHAISYTKGCYTGQETVARVHFRGHVNRHLRGLSSPGDTPLPLHADLVDEAGKVVGDVRSSAVSPRLGAVALAMVRREVLPGSSVGVRWEGGETSASVLSLPFPF
jgi:folate-binding protein YgfZ